MPDGHVVSGEEQFTLLRFPDGDCPIADETAEAVGFPAIESGSDDGNVGRVGFEIAAKICNQRVPIVEATIPCEDKASVGEVRLFLTARLDRCVERDDREAQRSRPRNAIRRPGLAASRTR